MNNSNRLLKGSVEPLHKKGSYHPIGPVVFSWDFWAAHVPLKRPVGFGALFLKALGFGALLLKAQWW